MYKPPSAFKQERPQSIPENEGALNETAPAQSQSSQRLTDPDRLLMDIRKGLEEFKKRETLSSLIGSPRKQQPTHCNDGQPQVCSADVGWCTPPVSGTPRLVCAPQNGWCTPPAGDRYQHIKSQTPSPCRTRHSFPQKSLVSDQGNPHHYFQPLQSAAHLKSSGWCTPSSSGNLGCTDGHTSSPSQAVWKYQSQLPVDMLDYQQGTFSYDHGSCSVDPFNSPPRHLTGCTMVDENVGRATPSRATPASRAGTSFCNYAKHE